MTNSPLPVEDLEALAGQHGASFTGTGWGDEPVLPLTPDSITAVLAQLKKGGYRSAAGYMSTA